LAPGIPLQVARPTAGIGWRDEFVLLAPAVVVLVLVSSQTGFSRYIRYVLPVLPFVFIWVSQLGRLVGVRQCTAALASGRTNVVRIAVNAIKQIKGGSAADRSGAESPCAITGVLTALLLMWSVGSSLWYAPHWMSYFNELAGGPIGGPQHLIDAQVDWGQDLLYLKKWLNQHPETKPLGLVYFGPLNPAVAEIEYTLPPKGVILGDNRIDAAGVPDDLKPGWYAVSVNYLYGYEHYIYDPSGGREWVTQPYYSYFRRFHRVATAGYSIYIYHLTERDVALARK
jgi:hypothetical protein